MRGFQSLALIYFVAIGLAATTIAIHGYGPWPDEMWGYPVATALYRGQPLYPSPYNFALFGRYFPYVTGEYQGAFKAYLYWLFLMVTGGAGAYQRFLNFTLFLGVGFGMVWAIRPIARGWLCVMPVLIAISNPNYVAFVPSDMGPFLLQNVFTVLAFGFLLRAASLNSPQHLAAALACASAVAGDKLTGIPVSAGLGVASLYVALQQREKMLTLRWLAPYTLAVALPALPFIVFFTGGGLSSTVGWIGTSPDTQVERISRAAEYLGRAFSGDHSFLLSYIYHLPDHIGVPHYSFAIGSVAIMMICAAVLHPAARRSAPAYALALLCLVLAVAIMAFVLVPSLGRPWNYLIFDPLIYLGMAAMIAWACGYVEQKIARVAMVTLLAINFGAAQYNVIAELIYQATHRGRDFASMAIYPLIDKLMQLGVKTAVCFDYGPCPSILLLTTGEIAMDDRPFSADFDKEGLEQLLRRPNTVLVLRRLFDVSDPAWHARLQRGTNWFFKANGNLTQFEILTLPRFDDTQYMLVKLK